MLAGMPGYSSTPLPKKLGIRGNTRLLPLNAPDDYRDILGELPAGAQIVEEMGGDTDMVHVFTARQADLEEKLTLRRTWRTTRWCG
ncbi:MAG: hypothetical protein R3F14_30380 [Polyangiaceae bacterium]